MILGRKRRSQLFLRSDKLATAFGLASKRLRNKPVKKLDIGHSYSPSSIDSCSSLNPTECLSVQTVLNSCSPRSIVSRKTLKQCIMLHFQISSLVNANESINGSFLDSRWLVIEEASSRNSNNELILGLKSLSSEETHRRETTLLNCNNRSRPVIPIGPGFQAEIP
ncbi:hypothetical protein BDE02_16G099400 [Populus trichocarpa]|nr:hypothetical protein BDE02_16G099400 [Populus trichocarpa]